MIAASPGGHYQRFDSMAVDERGNVLVATLLHGGITVITRDGLSHHHVALTDRFTTNLCFGGLVMRAPICQAFRQRPPHRPYQSLGHPD